MSAIEVFSQFLAAINSHDLSTLCLRTTGFTPARFSRTMTPCWRWAKRVERWMVSRGGMARVRRQQAGLRDFREALVLESLRRWRSLVYGLPGNSLPIAALIRSLWSRFCNGFGAATEGSGSTGYFVTGAPRRANFLNEIGKTVLIVCCSYFYPNTAGPGKARLRRLATVAIGAPNATNCCFPSAP
jgi:hypothetical protein